MTDAPKPKNIRLTLEQIHDESASDLVINPDQLTIESLKSAPLFSKWSKLLSVEKVFLRKSEFEYAKKEREIWEYYSGKSDPEVYKAKPFGHKVLKGNVDRYLDSDEDLEAAKAKVVLQKEKVEAIERILKAINDRQWLIRNAIENRKFEAGL